MADFIHLRDRHAAREILVGGDFAHCLLHAADRTGDLAIQQIAERGQNHGGRERDDRNGGSRRGQIGVQRGDRGVLAAVLLHAQRFDDAFQFGLILHHVAEESRLRDFVLAAQLEFHGIVDRAEIVAQAFLRLRHQSALRLAVGLLELQIQRLFQCGALDGQLFIVLLRQLRIRLDYHRHRQQLHGFQLRHQIGRRQHARHHAFGNGSDLNRTAARLEDGVAADDGGGDQRQYDEQRNAKTDGHAIPLVVDWPGFRPCPCNGMAGGATRTFYERKDCCTVA